MGDALAGLYGGGTSGSIGAGRGNTKNQNTYLGESYGQKPLEDIMARLAASSNQKQAQQNLLFGGPGYGGSFETAEQKAQRAAGQPVDNSKPYGGWGGYGSTNPVQSWDPSNTRPDWKTAGPGAAGFGQPAPGGASGGVPVGGGGGGGTGAPLPTNPDDGTVVQVPAGGANGPYIPAPAGT